MVQTNSQIVRQKLMCRNIKTLFNFDPPASADEIQEAAIQFVRKLSGFRKPSRVNQKAFDSAVDAISKDARMLLQSLRTENKPKNRDEEEKKAHEKAVKRFGVSNLETK